GPPGRYARQRRRAHAAVRAVPERAVKADVVFKPLRELGALLESRKLSPVELTEHFLERLERFGPRYNAVVTVMREHALLQARRAAGDITACRHPAPPPAPPHRGH